MAKLIAVACLLLGVIAAADAMEPLFSEYLAAHNAGGAELLAMHGAGQHQAEKATMCFRESNGCNSLPCPTGCLAGNSINTLVCAECADGDGDRSHGNAYDQYNGGSNLENQLRSAIDVGHVLLSYQFVNSPFVPLSGVTGVSYSGNFFATFTIKTEAAACSLPEACNDITIDVKGVAYYVDDAIRVGPASSSTDDCGTPHGRTGFSETVARGGAREVTAKGPAGTPGTDQVWHGPASVYIGHAEVYSRGPHAPKFPRAHFQLSYFGPTLLGQPTRPDVPRLGDGVYRFDLYAQKHN